MEMKQEISKKKIKPMCFFCLVTKQVCFSERIEGDKVSTTYRMRWNTKKAVETKQEMNKK